MALSDNENTILIYFLDRSTVFSLIELLIFALKREGRISRLLKPKLSHTGTCNSVNQNSTCDFEIS